MTSNSTTEQQTSTGFSVHPVADLFPMLPDDELADLAADITERGLLQPIVLDPDGQILDGRNRYAACQLAGIEPAFTTYDGADPAGYALSVNIARRHLKKSQTAMVVAKSQKFGVYGAQKEAAQMFGVSAEYLRQAQMVLDCAPDLADAVVDGSLALNNAYEQARQRKEAAESTDALMASLRRDAPDLADQVTEERLQLHEALAALRARQVEEQRQRRVATELLCTHVITLAQMDGADTGERYDPELALPGRKVTDAAIADAIAALKQLRQTWKERKLS